jgi:hypothetical protein
MAAPDLVGRSMRLPDLDRRTGREIHGIGTPLHQQVGCAGVFLGCTVPGPGLSA